MSTTTEAALASIICVLVLCANLGVLALTIKLYTEYTKDRAQDRRSQSGRAT